mgnify:CR=1 FL=1
MNQAATPQSAPPDVHAVPLDQIDVSNPELFRTDSHWPYFRRLRDEAPVHYCAESLFGAYWSVTRFQDIMEVETHPQLFSSESAHGGITIMDTNAAASLPMFIAMDPPKHDEQRKAVNPIVAPDNLAKLEHLIRRRTAEALDQLPVDEPFDWVERVSINLTTQMLATLFDFPWEDRAKLSYWSDVTTALVGAGLVESEAHRMEIFTELAEYMTRLWNERVNAEPGNDLISMMAHADSTRNMSPEEFLGNLLLLIVGGNDTTRNSMSGGLLALGFQGLEVVGHAVEIQGQFGHLAFGVQCGGAGTQVARREALRRHGHLRKGPRDAARQHPGQPRRHHRREHSLCHTADR